MRNYTIPSQHELVSFIEQAKERTEIPLEQLPLIWKALNEVESWSWIVDSFNALHVMASIGYLQNDRENWKHWLNTILEHSIDAIPENITPSPMIGIGHLTAALMLRDSKKTRLIANRLMLDRPSFNNELPESYVAEILARAADSDFESALKNAKILYNECQNKSFSKTECVRYTGFADAMTAIVTRDTPKLNQALQVIETERENWVELQLNRWKQEKPCDLGITDLWDFEVMTLLVFAQGSGMEVTNQSPFFDMNWLKA